MANLTGIREIFSGDTTIVDTVAQYPMLSRARDENGNEYIYLTGCSSTVLGSWVIYDELGATTLLAANAKGFVAVAMAAIDSTSEYGWYCIFGNVEARVVTGTSADTSCGRETADGCVGDGRAAGDEIIGAMIRDGNATGSTAALTCQISYPFVNDATGA